MNDNTNVFDYLEWRGDLLFQQSPFNEIDGLILSILAYLDYSFIKSSQQLNIREAVKRINALPNKVKLNGPGPIMPSVVDLANKVASAERFSGMGVCKYSSIIDESKEMQFAAVTFLLPDNTAFLSFRGTDNSLIGWKEDLNMSFTNGIPSQMEAAFYAEYVIKSLSYPARLGGHSKGGNLAIWAAANLGNESQKRVIQIYSNDSPGFNREFIVSSKYAGIKNKVLSFVPEASIVGVLMEHDNYTIIRSSSPSIFQHDPFSWTVIANQFVRKGKRTLGGRQMDRVVNAWIRSMSESERKELVESIYDIFSSGDAKTINDLDKAKIKSVFYMQKTFREMEPEKQEQLVTSLAKIFFNSEMLINSDILSQLGILFWNKRS